MYAGAGAIVVVVVCFALPLRAVVCARLLLLRKALDLVLTPIADSFPCLSRVFVS